MDQYNKRLFPIFKATMMAILIIIPTGLIYQSIKTAEFLRNCPDDSCRSWLGMLYLIVIPGEVYLILIYLWLSILRKRRMNESLKFIQLIMIFILGIIPGILLIYPVVFKD